MKEVDEPEKKEKVRKRRKKRIMIEEVIDSKYTRLKINTLKQNEEDNFITNVNSLDNKLQEYNDALH